uniref:Uncharacterized protein n=1 Tax=Cacopsylla melanoneura TaxID=428564 RepID=A0A8D8X6W2_9HEMI
MTLVCHTTSHFCLSTRRIHSFHTTDNHLTSHKTNLFPFLRRQHRIWPQRVHRRIPNNARVWSHRLAYTHLVNDLARYQPVRLGTADTQTKVVHTGILFGHGDFRVASIPGLA